MDLVEPGVGEVSVPRADRTMWLAILLVAIGIDLLTGSPLLAPLVPVVAAARPPVRSAFWLRASDPSAARGWVCFWFYLATAGWRAAGAALVSWGAMVVVLLATGRQPNLGAFGLIMISLVCGVALSSIIGLVGIASAWRARVQVFVIPKLAWLCGGDYNAIAAGDG